MSTLPITTIILAEEQSQNLQRAIASVQWSEQIIIVTRNPAFPSKDLAKNVSLEVVSTQSLDFAQLRNAGQVQAQTEWVFFLDSDEVFDPRAEAQLTQIMSQPAVEAVAFQRKDFFLGQKLEWGEVRNVWVTRLARSKNAHWQRPVHEIMIVSGTVQKSHLTISHFSHQSIASFLAKIILYSQLEAADRFRQKVTVAPWQVFVWPAGKFIQNYVIRLGWLDGWRGFIYALMMSIHSFAVRALLYEKTAS